MAERRGSLHSSAYEPRKPRQFSKQKSMGTQYTADGERGTLPVQSMDVTARAIRFETKLRDGDTCRFCGAKGSKVVTIKHIKSGGIWELSNAAIACQDCEQASWLKSTDTFQQKRAFIRKYRGLTPDP